MFIQIFTLGGSFIPGNRFQDKFGEVFNSGSNSWRSLAGISANDTILTDDKEGIRRSDNYGFFFAWHGNSGTHSNPMH